MVKSENHPIKLFLFYLADFLWFLFSFIFSLLLILFLCLKFSYFFLLFYFSLFMVVVFKFSQPNNSLPPTKRTFLWPERPMSFIWLSSFCFYFISFPVVCSFYFYVLNFPNFYVFLFLLLYGSCFSYWLLHVIYPLLLRSCMAVDDVNSTSTSSSDQNRVNVQIGRIWAVLELMKGSNSSASI